MKQIRTWVVVADGAEARILLHKSGEHRLQQLLSHEFHEFDPPTHELVTERLPRGHESGSPTRHAIQPKSDPHQQEKEKFIEKLIAHIAASAQRNEFDGLVVVAPAPALAMFRNHYPHVLKARLKREIVHDYVHQDSDYIFRQIGDLIP